MASESLSPRESGQRKWGGAMIQMTKRPSLWWMILAAQTAFLCAPSFSTGFSLVQMAVILSLPLPILILLHHFSFRIQVSATPSQKALIITNIVLLGFFATVAYFYVANYVLRLDLPNPFSLIPGATFTDLTGTREEHMGLDPYRGHAGYPPLAWTLTWPLYLIGDPYAEIAVLVSLSLATLTGIFMALMPSLPRLQRLQTIFILLFMSFPMIFLVDRGNMDLVILPLVFGSLYLFSKERFGWSSVLISLAIGMKIVPAIYLLFFVFRRKFKHIVFILALAGVLNVISASLFPEGVVGSLQHMNRNIADFYVTWTETDFSIYGGHSLRGLFRVLDYIYLSSVPQNGPHRWHKIYKALVAVLFALTIAFLFLKRRTLEFWKQIFLMTTTFLVLPMFSPDYKMSALLLPAILFIDERRADANSILYSILFGLIFIPKEIVRFPFVRWETFHDTVGIGVIVNPLLLISFSVVIIWAELRRRPLAQVDGNKPT